jgi:hypothetical protein
LDTRSSININVLLNEGGTKKLKRALFILHDSFLPDMIKEMKAKEDGSLDEFEFQAYEAFTVGIVLENTDNSISIYEIDLNQLDNLPEGFKYTDILLSIDEVNKELLQLQ